MVARFAAGTPCGGENRLGPGIAVVVRREHAECIQHVEHFDRVDATDELGEVDDGKVPV